MTDTTQAGEWIILLQGGPYDGATHKVYRLGPVTFFDHDKGEMSRYERVGRSLVYRYASPAPR